MPFASMHDLDLYYETHGAGDRVVIVHGTGHDLRNDPKRQNGPLTAGHEVLMFDQRGLGQSDKPDVAYTMEDYADDFAGLLDFVGWENAHVVGISFGGMVAQHIALRHPQRVDRLVLACTSSGGAGGASFDLLGSRSLPRAEQTRLALLRLDTRNDPTTDPPTFAPLFDLIAPLMERPPRNADDPAATVGARRQLEARAQHDTWQRLPEISAPCMVAGGQFDAQAPPANVEALAARIPNAELRFFDGGHMFLAQDRTAWPAVVEFLDRT